MDADFPETKTKVEAGSVNPLLASDKGKDEKKWVHGFNCVYHDEKEKGKYRVGILTTTGWKHYGSFKSLGTASYVANIAILVEESDFTYDLNKVEHKDSQEIKQWRSISVNKTKENLARERLPQYKSARKRRIEEERKREIEYREQKRALKIKEDLEQRIEQQKKKEERKETERKREEEKLQQLQAEKDRLSKLSVKELLNLSEQQHLSGREHRAIRKELDKRREKYTNQDFVKRRR